MPEGCWLFHTHIRQAMHHALMSAHIYLHQVVPSSALLWNQCLGLSSNGSQFLAGCNMQSVTMPCKTFLVCLLLLRAVTTPVSTPSPRPPVVTPPPNPKPPTPKPSPPPTPPPSPNGYLDVMLYSRAQANCGALGSDVGQGLVRYIDVQLVLLGQGGYHTKQDGTDCTCRLVQVSAMQSLLLVH